MLKKGDFINNRYEILENIGAGGMSDVYKAKCHKLNRYVAIKILKLELSVDENLVNRFKVEAQAAAGLSHPNIVAVYDVGDEEDFHYIVMEYLEGKTLKQVISEKGVLSEKEIYHVAFSVLAALSHAHQNSIIHRDIKPQNIFWTNDNKIKVMDFGIAHIITDKTIDVDEELVASVHYVSPEQVRGLAPKECSDIYSFGITMYEMAVGKVPYDGDNPVNIAVMHLEKQIPSICDQNPKISKNFEIIIKKATERMMINRYATAKDMLNELRQAYQHPDELIKAEKDINNHTLMISKNDIKQIWSKNEYRDFGGEKDPYENYIKWGAILSALVVVVILTALIVTANIDKWVPTMIKVPYIVNMNINDVEQNYPELKFEIEGYIYHDTIPKGSIIEQEVEANSSVKENTVIGLIVSKGVEEIEVPNVMDYSYTEAEKILIDKGFYVERVLENDDVATIGNVFKQLPVANTPLPKGGLVTIYVSKGAEVELVEVPDLINKPKQEAISKLMEDSFIVNVIESYNDNVEKGRVIMMSIAPGNQVVKGSSIDITVSLGKKYVVKKSEIRVNSPFGPNQETGIIKITLTQDEEEKVLFEKEVNIGEFPITLAQEGTGSAILTVYLDGVKQYTKQIVFTEE